MEGNAGNPGMTIPNAALLPKFGMPEAPKPDRERVYSEEEEVDVIPLVDDIVVLLRLITC